MSSLLAAQQAYKAGVLHRDISAGNIMIVKDQKTNAWRGVLIDWDMCLLLDQRDKNHKVRTARTGTWAFISARLLRSSPSKPVVHSLGDDMESVFWVLAYELLRYTSHTHGPYQLFKKMQDLFSDATTNHGQVTGGEAKLLAITCCSVGRTKVGLVDFKMSTLHNIFNVLGIAFNPRYDDENNPNATNIFMPFAGHTVDWDNPDDKWLSTFLRQAAEVMAPLGVTPTALESPTKDSKPPADKESWKRAKVTLHPPDYCEMEWSKDEHDSKKAQDNAFNAATSSRMDHIDGLSYHTNKHSLAVYKDESQDQVPAKKHRPTS
ncbi:hypothetical protein CVT25_009658 [Psilocybe cyanescens]|uniref:Protein kinase domain-containing protein n=1 Tax=Psilocybe cyanescens TaxID=93625 RepID=A0A409XGZ2_PSICY|nr:hypothetical protein CVT25_009658 [Psilocybe cyanescens]